MPTLGYWNIRGMGQPLRFLLEYVGETYDEKRYAVDKPMEWFGQDKITLGLPFPNIPYYIDGDVKITGSVAVMKYIARKHKLADSLTENDQIVLDMVEIIVYDLMWVGLVGILSGKGDFETQKAEYLETYMPTKLQVLSEHLENKTYILGNKITYLDFLLYEALYEHFKFAPEVFNKFQNLKEFLKVIEDLPAISSYMKSDRYIHSPIFGPIFKWQG
jgi:glutathione S-transferase